MPWFPDFVNASELARRQTRAAGQADPVGLYLAALNSGDAYELETVWPAEVVVHDPRAGEIRGHRQLRRFVTRSQAWLADRHARIETMAVTCAGGRAVVELLAHLSGDGWDLAWPVAVVAESRNDLSIAFRIYCSLWPVDGRRHFRASILESRSTRPGGVVGRYHAALRAGDADAIVTTFAPDGYLREPVGRPDIHRGADELRAYFTGCFGAGGGIREQLCVTTDDGVHCAVEYTCDGWGSHNLPPQAGICVFERATGGLLAAVRVYDDIEAPVDRH